MAKTSKIPEGFATITSSLIVDGASDAIELYTRAFGATEDYRMESSAEQGKILHACLTIGNSKLFLADVSKEMGPKTSNSVFYLYVDDVDATFKQAKLAGLKEIEQPKDQFWGDRVGVVTDRFGNGWTLATHVRDVSEEEMEEGKKNFGKKAA